MKSPTLLIDRVLVKFLSVLQLRFPVALRANPLLLVCNNVPPNLLLFVLTYIHFGNLGVSFYLLYVVYHVPYYRIMCLTCDTHGSNNIRHGIWSFLQARPSIGREV